MDAVARWRSQSIGVGSVSGSSALRHRIGSLTPLGPHCACWHRASRLHLCPQSLPWALQAEAQMPRGQIGSAPGPPARRSLNKKPKPGWVSTKPAPGFQPQIRKRMRLFQALFPSGPVCLPFSLQGLERNSGSPSLFDVPLLPTLFLLPGSGLCWVRQMFLRPMSQTSTGQPVVPESTL